MHLCQYKKSQEQKYATEEKLLLYMVSEFHDRDNLLSTIILCMLKHLSRLTRPKKSLQHSLQDNTCLYGVIIRNRCGLCDAQTYYFSYIYTHMHIKYFLEPSNAIAGNPNLRYTYK